MVVHGLFMRLFRSVFREQKTRLTVDWLTHTDDLIMRHLDDAERARPEAVAAAIDRSPEYVSDRCRQLALRGFLDVTEPGGETGSEYRLADLGDRYLADEISPDELEAIETG